LRRPKGRCLKELEQMPKQTNKTEILEPEKYYHIFNRAVGDERLFKNDTDYIYFLNKIKRFILPVAEIISYCLIPNHFHLFVKTLDEKQIQKNMNLVSLDPVIDKLNQPFSNFFNSYTKSINLRYSRKGKLFMLPYKRILVEDDSYIVSVINYIHRNPIHHGLVENHSDWKYSSFNDYISENPTIINRALGLEYFGSLQEFKRFHQKNCIKQGFDKYSVENQ